MDFTDFKVVFPQNIANWTTPGVLRIQNPFQKIEILSKMNYCISSENTVGLGTNKCIQVWYLSKIWILVQINAQRMKSTTFPTTGLAYSQKLSTGNNQLGASVHQKNSCCFVLIFLSAR